jgi:predicted dehydrogenase
MRSLFIGLGSIGKRNLASCKRVRPHYAYAAWRSSSSSGSPSKDESAGVTQFTDLDQVKRFAPELVWICNPTAFHRETLEKLNTLPIKPAIFLEKPVAHLAKDIATIRSILENWKTPFFYGCVFRVHPLIQRVRQLVTEASLGRALHYQITCASYLPDWRPGRDYREIYSAHAEMGGGVALDLIHEFDYASYWFGGISSIQGFRAKLSPLEIDSDDTCCAVLKHASGSLGTIRLSYYRQSPVRTFEIQFESGFVQGDLLTGELRLPDGSIENHSIVRDALHDRQAEVVFESLEKGSAGPRPSWTIDECCTLNRMVVEIPFFHFDGRKD